MLRIHGIINQHASIFYQHASARPCSQTCFPAPVCRAQDSASSREPQASTECFFGVASDIVAGAFAAGVSVAGVSVDRELANNTEGVRA
jgi:hypothetical protein